MEKSKLLWAVVGLSVLLAVFGIVEVVKRPTKQFVGSAETSASNVTNTDVTTKKDSLYLWGQLEVASTSFFTGPSTFSATSTFSSSLSVGKFFQAGAVASISTTSATYTLSANEVCNNGTLTLNANGLAPTWTLPSTTTLFSTCLSATGKMMRLPIINGTTTSSIIAVPSGAAILAASSTTIVGSKYAALTIIRDSTNTYKVLMDNYVN